ncbi:MAG: YHYH protein [Flavobacteriales bacterium]|nr:YHYH protein [Flavobacteriales bacterium]
MGVFWNPGTPTNQNYIYRIPRNPNVASNNTDVPLVFSIGTLINGVPIFGHGDASSYDPQLNDNDPQGLGIWNVDAWYSEGWTLDTAYAAHPQQQGAYHSHATPYLLYSDDTTAHSPIVGWAFDGYPIYGPYGYSNPNDMNSPTKRIRSSFQLRNISTRTTLPDGSQSTPPGPNVSNTFPLGMYNEDYEYVQGLGDLDEHNGRFGKTPEYPNGTYAYFVAVDDTGGPAYPYYLGDTFYGDPDQASLSPQITVTIPAGATCLSNTVSVEEEIATNPIDVFPNPASSKLFINSSEKIVQLQVYDNLGSVVLNAKRPIAFNLDINIESLDDGVYWLRIETNNKSAISKPFVVNH